MLYSGSLSLPHPHRLLFLRADHEGIHEGSDGEGGIHCASYLSLYPDVSVVCIFS